MEKNNTSILSGGQKKNRLLTPKETENIIAGNVVFYESKMNRKHFELTRESKINYEGVTVFRIKCVKDFIHARNGDLGGWVQKLENLNNNAWVSEEAEVYENANVYENALISGHAKVRGTAKVYGYAKVYENAEIYFDGVEVSDNAEIYGYTHIRSNPRIYGNAKVFGNTTVFGHCVISDNAKVYGDTYIEDSGIHGNAEIYGTRPYGFCSGVVIIDSNVWGDAKVYEQALLEKVNVNGFAKIHGNAHFNKDHFISGNANIQSDNDYCDFAGFGSRSFRVSAYRGINEDIIVECSCGCFKGTINEFEQIIVHNHKGKRYGLQYSIMLEMMRLKFNLDELPDLEPSSNACVNSSFIS